MGDFEVKGVGKVLNCVEVLKYNMWNLKGC